MSKRFGAGSGPTQRQLRVGELIRRALSDLLARGDLHSDELSGMSITVGEVRTSPDLKIADVFVTPLGGQGAEGLTKALAAAKGEIRREVAKAVKLKYAPDFRFHLDQTFDQMDDTRRMLAEDSVRRDLDAGADPDAESGKT